MPTRKRIDWQERAAELARRLPRNRLHPAVLAWADAAPPRQVWAVSFSGGADSLAVLLLLWAHWPERRGRLRALHFDHRLRGRESRADAVFCRQVGAALGVKLTAGSWLGRHDGASEAEARSARMGFLEKQARVVWFGHHMDDIAESMLMRLARGSGAGGLAAPRPVQRMPGNRVHLRLLLTLPKAEILGALRATRIPWREDSSNARGDYFRNRIRLEVVPGWIAAAQRDALGGAARSRMLLEEDEAALADWVAEIQPFAPSGRLMLARLEGKPRALARRALHQWLLTHPDAGQPSRQAFDALLDALILGKPTRHSLGREGFAVIRGGILRFEKQVKPRRKFQRGAN